MKILRGEPHKHTALNKKHTDIYPHICIYIYVYVCVYIYNIYIYVCMYICMYIYIIYYIICYIRYIRPVETGEAEGTSAPPSL